MLEQHLLQLMQELKIEIPDLEETEGVFSMPIDYEREVTFTDLQPGVYFFAHLGPCPKEKREQLFSHMLHGNLFGQGTGGGVIGLDEKGEGVSLSLAMPWEMDYKEFRDALEEFINYIDFWTNELSSFTDETKSTIL